MDVVLWVVVVLYICVVVCLVWLGLWVCLDDVNFFRGKDVVFDVLRERFVARI